MQQTLHPEGLVVTTYPKPPWELDQLGDGDEYRMNTLACTAKSAAYERLIDRTRGMRYIEAAVKVGQPGRRHLSGGVRSDNPSIPQLWPGAAGAVVSASANDIIFQVVAEWTIPTVSWPILLPSSQGYSWAAGPAVIDAAGNSVLLASSIIALRPNELTGVASDPWLNWAPYGEVTISGLPPLSPGDAVEYILQFLPGKQAGGAGIVTIVNFTAGFLTVVALNVRHSVSMDATAAAWIVESFPAAPSYTLEFTGCTATTFSGATLPSGGGTTVNWTDPTGLAGSEATLLGADKVQVFYL